MPHLREVVSTSFPSGHALESAIIYLTLGALLMRILSVSLRVPFPPDDGKDKAAQSLGQRGGKARAAALSKKRRQEIAKAAAAKRWQKA